MTADLTRSGKGASETPRGSRQALSTWTAPPMQNGSMTKGLWGQLGQAGCVPVPLKPLRHFAMTATPRRRGWRQQQLGKGQGFKMGWGAWDNVRASALSFFLTQLHRDAWEPVCPWCGVGSVLWRRADAGAAGRPSPWACGRPCGTPGVPPTGLFPASSGGTPKGVCLLFPPGPALAGVLRGHQALDAHCLVTWLPRGPASTSSSVKRARKQAPTPV